MHVGARQPPDAQTPTCGLRGFAVKVADTGRAAAAASRAATARRHHDLGSAALQGPEHTGSGAGDYRRNDGKCGAPFGGAGVWQRVMKGAPPCWMLSATF